MNNEELLEKIGNLIDQKIEPLKQGQERLEQEMRAGFQKVNQRLDQVINDNGGFFHETRNRIDAIKDNQEKQIEIIEETLGLDEPPHKN
jgi:hypothetical protein